MQPYRSTPSPSGSINSQDADLAMPPHSTSSSGLFLPSSSSNSFAEPLQFTPSTAPATKLSLMFIDRIRRESNLSKAQYAELQKMLAVCVIYLNILS